jgi:hypothetical protein
VGSPSQQYVAISRVVADPWPSTRAYSARLCSRPQQRRGSAKYTISRESRFFIAGLAKAGRGESANKKKKGEEEYWVRATLVEALFGLGKAAESDAEFVVAKKAALEPWMINTTEEQLTKLRALLR